MVLEERNDISAAMRKNDNLQERPCFPYGYFNFRMLNCITKCDRGPAICHRLPGPCKGRWRKARDERCEPRASGRNQWAVEPRSEQGNDPPGSDRYSVARAGAPVVSPGRFSQGSLRSPWALHCRPCQGLTKGENRHFLNNSVLAGVTGTESAFLEILSPRARTDTLDFPL